MIDTDSNKPGYLYFADGYDKYWRAKVAVMRANLSFKAVALASGKHRVVFEYAPTKLRWAVGTFEFHSCWAWGMLFIMNCAGGSTGVIPVTFDGSSISHANRPRIVVGMHTPILGICCFVPVVDVNRGGVYSRFA